MRVVSGSRRVGQTRRRTFLAATIIGLALILAAVASADQSLPATSSVKVPAVSASAVAAPAVKAPAVSAPAVAVPAVKAPSVSTPQVSVPKVAVPSVSTPKSDVSRRRSHDVTHAEGHDADRDHAEGHDADGHDADGDHAEGHDADRDHAEGHDAEGDHAEGDDAEGHDARGHRSVRNLALGDGAVSHESHRVGPECLHPRDAGIIVGDLWARDRDILIADRRSNARELLAPLRRWFGPEPREQRGYVDRCRCRRDGGGRSLRLRRSGSSGSAPSATPTAMSVRVSRAERSAVSGKGPLKPPKKNASAKAWNRYLSRLVRVLGACVSSLAPQAQRIIMWRTGHGRGRGESEAQVARRLGTSLRRERKLESQAARALRVAAADGRCGQAPVPVSVSSGLLAGAPADVLQDLTRGTEGSPATQTGTSSPAAGQLSQPNAAGSRGSKSGTTPAITIQKSSLPTLPTAGSGFPWLLLLIAALVVGALMLVVSRRSMMVSYIGGGGGGGPEERPPRSTGSGRKAATPPPESGDEAASAGAAAAGAAAGAGRRRRPPSPRKATTDAGAGSPDSDEKAAGAAAAGAAAGAGRRRRPPSPRKATTDAGAGSPDSEREGRRGRGRWSRSRGGSSASSAQLEEGHDGRRCRFARFRRADGRGPGRRWRGGVRER